MSKVIRLNSESCPAQVAERALGHHLIAQFDRLRPLASLAPQSELHWVIGVNGTRYRCVITVEGE